MKIDSVDLELPKQYLKKVELSNLTFAVIQSQVWMKIQKSEMKSTSLLSTRMKTMQDYLRIE